MSQAAIRGLSRRFLNLILDSGIPGVRSLSCIDLAQHNFLSPTTTTGGGSATHSPAAAAVEMFELPDPYMAVGGQAFVDCFPLADRKGIVSDQAGRTFLFDAAAPYMTIMPSLHKPKSTPISIFVPSTGGRADGGCCLYVMERHPKPEAPCSSAQQPSDQFEAFVCSSSSSSEQAESWQCQQLPPPPFVRDRARAYDWSFNPKIMSYAVLGGGSHICISVARAGTYCMNTESHVWSSVGSWTLPFLGKVEYVPELKLWFGLSAESELLAAADLSTIEMDMESESEEPPLLLGEWKEQVRSPAYMDEWQDPQIFNLGSGRFCIARFFRRMLADYDDHYDDYTSYLVLNIVEVMPPPPVQGGSNCSGSNEKNGKELKLGGVATLKSLWHMSTISSGSIILDVF